MKLYWGSGSPFAWRAMLALIVKGVEFEDQCLDFGEREHKTPQYLAINPRGRVPALVDKETTVYESTAIIGYIDRKFPDKPLLGRTPAEAGRILRLMSEHDNYAYPAGIALLRPLFQGKKLEGDGVAESCKALRAEFEMIGKAFEGDPWLGGDAVSAADIVWYPTLMLLDRMMSKPEVVALDLGVTPFKDPTLKAWKQRFEGIPGVDRAYPPHWKS